MRSSPTFDPAVFATSDVANVIKWMFVVIPVVFLCVAFLFALRYKLDCKRFDCVMDGVKRLKAGQCMADFCAEEKADFELLTGKPADALWAVQRDAAASNTQGDPPAVAG